MNKLPYFMVGRKFCVYCGDVPDATDHVIPVSYQTSNHVKPAARRTNYGPVAFCCRSCNSILSNKVFDSFDLRCSIVSQSIDIITSPVIWSKAELSRLDFSLRDYIKREQARRLWLRYRSDWYQSRDYLLNLENLAWEPYLNKGHQLFHKDAYEFFEATLVWIKTLYK